MNRIDKMVVFRSLTHSQLERVLDIELGNLQNRIIVSRSGHPFVFRCTDAAKEFLLREGTDARYGARPLKRAVERHVVHPLSNLIATGQIGLGDIVKADAGTEGLKLIFSKQSFPVNFAGVEAAAVASQATASAN